MGVAQLVEHLVVVQDVAGSSPVTHPKCPFEFEGALLISLTCTLPKQIGQQAIAQTHWDGSANSTMNLSLKSARSESST